MIRRLGLVLLTLLVALPVLGSAPSAAAAPLDGISIRWGGIERGAVSKDGPVTVNGWAGGSGFAAYMTSDAGHQFFASRFDGKALAPGTYTAAPTAADGQVQVGLGSRGFGCHQVGTLVVHEISYAADGSPTILAADTTGGCGDASIRVGSTVPRQGLSFAARADAEVTLGYLGEPAAVGITVGGSAPVDFGAAKIVANPDPYDTYGPSRPEAFTITADGCAPSAVQPGATCTISVRVRLAERATVTAVLEVPDDTPGGTSRILLLGRGVTDSTGTYVPVAPTRLLDTRSKGGPKLGAGQVVSVPVLGRGELPTGSVGAVVVNLTSVGATSSTWLTAWPSGTPQPGISSLNAVAGRNIANLVTVPVGADGAIRVANARGSSHVLVDVVGWYAADDTARESFGTLGLQYAPVEPTRVANGDLGPQEAVDLTLDFASPEDPEANSRIRALAVNVTVVRPTSGGFLSVWDSGRDEPATSTLNFARGEVVPNMAVTGASVLPGDTGVSIALANGSSATVRVLVDLVGVYTFDEMAGLRFKPVAPRRVIDTRHGVGLPKAPFGAGSTRVMHVGTDVAGEETVALVTNLTGIGATASTYLTQWDGDGARPGTSATNLAVGQTRAAASFVGLSADAGFATYNSLGLLDVAQDVMGTFEAYPGAIVPGTLDPTLTTTAGPSPAARTTGERNVLTTPRATAHAVVSSTISPR